MAQFGGFVAGFRFNQEELSAVTKHINCNCADDSGRF